MENEGWPPEWQRGLLELVVMCAVAAESEPTYGYRIVQRLDVSGFGKVKGGTLYPILARLEAAGYVSSHWGEGDGGPGRKFIEMTSAGWLRMAELATQWSAFQLAVGRMVMNTRTGVS